MKKIKIDLNQNSYDVLIDENIYPKIFSEIKKRKLYKNVLIVIDSKVFKLHKDYLNSCIPVNGYKIVIQKLSLNEKTKSLISVQKIFDKLLQNKFGRDSLIIAIGGGIIGDVSGFAAATYMRGIQFVQVPTTLLACVDSSVGGKTGINYADSKNIIGAFYQPKFVLIDTLFLKTLPIEERICGLGEIVKYVFLISDKFYNYFFKNISNLLELESKTIKKVIIESIKFKGNVVSEDERELGLRQILNFGHTFAHAFEVEQKHKIKHGEAVIIGIASALFLSKTLHLLSEEKFNQFLKVVILFSKFISIKNYYPQNVYKIMSADKKNRASKIQFVLIKDIGEIVLGVEANKQDVIKSIEFGLNMFKPKQR